MTILDRRYARHAAEVIIYQISRRPRASLCWHWLLAFLLVPATLE